MITDEELIKGCVKENKDSQYALYQKYAGKMMGICLRYAPNRMEAEDILQESFIKIFDNIAKFRNEGSFEGWMKRIVVRVALRHYQKKVQNRIDFHDDIEEKDHVVFMPKAIDNFNEKDLMTLINTLPQGYRLVFNLYAIEGYSHTEIGEMLNIGESTSRSQLNKARKWLQAKLNEFDKVVYEKQG
jgi:RNA polymerase sigma-70 factor (ECF subfamily)